MNRHCEGGGILVMNQPTVFELVPGHGQLSEHGLQLSEQPLKSFLVATHFEVINVGAAKKMQRALRLQHVQRAVTQQ